jgi:hypothetical protein
MFGMAVISRKKGEQKKQAQMLLFAPFGVSPMIYSSTSIVLLNPLLSC